MDVIDFSVQPIVLNGRKARPHTDPRLMDVCIYITDAFQSLRVMMNWMVSTGGTGSFTCSAINQVFGSMYTPGKIYLLKYLGRYETPSTSFVNRKGNRLTEYQALIPSLCLEVPCSPGFTSQPSSGRGWSTTYLGTVCM